MVIRKVSLLFILLLVLWAHPAVASETEEAEISGFLEQLFQARAQYLLNQEPNTIAGFYSKAVKTSRHAMQIETRRTQYINAWAYERGIDLVDISCNISRVRIRLKDNVAKVYLVNSLRIDYAYQNQNYGPQWYGIGTRHSLTLKKLDNKWFVISDWYSDPMEEDPDNVPTASPSLTIQPKPENLGIKSPSRTRSKFNRQKAVAYADKYAGTAWGSGNDNRYNPKYPDYNYNGGDCTNFASQVLGDPLEGGGLKMTGGWRANRHGGTESWVRTDSFKRFLVYSGYGRVLTTGTFHELVTPSARFPNGAINQLKPGDLIGYIMKRNDIDHFSIVVGKDANGYVLVNSHSGDRYHVPWDIGWDKYTKFVLIHIND